MHKEEKAYTIAIVGPEEVISGFKALGVTTFPAETSEKALDALVEIKNNVEIIFTFFAAYTVKTLEFPINDIICAIPAIPK